MARKTKEPAAERARPSISQAKLRSLVKTAKLARQNMNSISGALGVEIKEAQEKNHLDRGALNVVLALDRMEPERGRDRLENILLYIDLLGLNERFASVPRLPMDADGNAETGEEAEDPPKNVRPFRQPHGIAAE